MLCADKRCALLITFLPLSLQALLGMVKLAVLSMPQCILVLCLLDCQTALKYEN
jgi:hypothetical protein